VAGVDGLTSSTRLTRPQTVTPDQLRAKRRNGLASDYGRATSTPTRPKASTTPGAPPPFFYPDAPPCSTYWGQKLAIGYPAYNSYPPYAPCGYTPAQVRGAYGLDKTGMPGSGVTVAVVDAYASPTLRKDADTYAVKHGGKAFAAGQYAQLTPSSYQLGYDDTENFDQCWEQSWYAEQSLDVEAVHGVAPAAKVLYGAAARCLHTDLIDTLNTIVDGHKADSITNSWSSAGEPDPVTDAALLAAYQRVFVQAALTGIGFYFASGDYGDNLATSGRREVDFPASSPWVTAAGGTSLGIGSRNDYQFEGAWGTGVTYAFDGAWDPAPPGDYSTGGGGGTSERYAQPWYQSGIVPASISKHFGAKPGRAVPDVSAVADPNTGFLVGETFTVADGSERYAEWRIGGTSLASPVLAGIEALADQAAGYKHGFANPAIYALAGTRGLRDVQKVPAVKSAVTRNFFNGIDGADGYYYALSTFGQLGTLTVAKGYDDTTGVGSPNGYFYVYGLGENG
jgi:subtilase family serine protease